MTRVDEIAGGWRMIKGETHLNGRVTLYHGDSRDVLKQLPDNSIDSVVTDPPYALVSIVKRFGGVNAAPAKGNDAYQRASAGFMGKQWDTGETAFAVEFWAEVMRVLKPGGHVIAASGTRTYHRLAVAIEDAGFEIRDMVQWLYGSGFPKSHDVSKGIDKAAGAEREVTGRAKGAASSDTESLGEFQPEYDLTAPATEAAQQWQGWGTALKPACEPWVLARKPLGEKTVAANVLAHGCGALNIDGCRVGIDEADREIIDNRSGAGFGTGDTVGGNQGCAEGVFKSHDAGRWPANVIHDGSDEVVAGFPETGPSTTGIRDPNGTMGYHGGAGGLPGVVSGHADNGGSAARFFYSAKADAMDRVGSKHPTVKPVDLMQYLCRLITPPGGVVLDPFAGSGSTGEAAWREGFRCVLIEREEEYAADIRRRLELADLSPETRAAILATRKADEPLGGLFAGLGDE